jgi:hypothetical protein
MERSREGAAGSRWHEWAIAISIAALAAIGVGAIWGESIQRWIDRPGEQPSAPARGEGVGASGSRL